MARRTKDAWAELVASWRDSGLTAAEFGEAHDVNPVTLKYWKWRIGKASEQCAPVAPRKKRERRTTFTEVSMQRSSPAPLDVTIGDVTIRVPAEASMDQLRSVLDVLRGPR